MKSIISANINTKLAEKLKKITKGARSRTVERAIRNYLEEKEAYSIMDESTLDILTELRCRPEISDSAKQYLRALWAEVRDLISDD